MGRILCLDYGHVRIGVALSDPKHIIASVMPYISVKKGNILKKIKDLIEMNDCEKIIIGLPLSLNGQETQKSLEVRRFCDKLQELLDIPVLLYDERLSTYAAENILMESGINRKKQKELKDSLSAQIVLQNYLDSLIN